MSTSDAIPQVTRALAEHAVGADLTDAPEAVLDLARRTLVDTVGVAIAARREDPVRILRSTLGSSVGSGRSTVLTSGERVDAPAAAWLNGTAGHALDYDDVTDHVSGHPSVVLWPAVLAVGEQVGASGRELVDAYTVGFDVMTSLADGLVIGEHYRQGWHATATLGVVAAAAAASRLLGIDVPTTRQALGLAATMAGGSRQNFGTMTKPLHAGLAARDGVLAATLAANGLTADAAQLEAPLGFFAMFADRSRLDAVLDAARTPYALLRHGINVKKFPACYNVQRTADAMLDLLGRDEVAAADVRRIRLTLEPNGFAPLIHHRPTTGLQGKFSGEYTIAASLVDRRIGLRTFTDAAVARPDVQTLVTRTGYAESATPPAGPTDWEHSYAVVEIETADGRALAVRSDVPRGDRRAPLDRAELEAKFRDCVEFSESGWDADKLLAGLWDVAGPGRFAGLDPMQAQPAP